MLPKVSAALSRFVTPIQTSSPGSSARERAFVPAQGKVLPFKDQADGQSGRQESGKRELEPSQPASSPEEKPPTLEEIRTDLGSAFLQLIASLKQHRASIFKWIGYRGYQLGLRATKRTGRLRKGAMLDVRVD